MNTFSGRDTVGPKACPRSSIWITAYGGARAAPCPQPSLRIPATPANRDYLRNLRAREATAWEMGEDLRQTIGGDSNAREG